MITFYKPILTLTALYKWQFNYRLLLNNRPRSLRLMVPHLSPIS